MKACYIGVNPHELERVYGPRQRAQLAELIQIDPLPALSAEDARLGEAEALFSTWGMITPDEDELAARLPRLKYVFYAAGSVQYFARPFLRRGIRVFSAWQANAVPVAEFTFAQISLALKGYFLSSARMRAGRSGAQALAQSYPGCYDATVGLLGCGAIGARVAEKLKALDVLVLVYDPFLSPERAEELGVTIATLEEVFVRSDVISNHLANLPATRHIIRGEHFSAMKPFATFINTGRGPQLDEGELYAALTAEPGRTALLDVLTDEERSDENPLSKLPNCFITPHIAGSSGNEVRRMADYMIEAAQHVLAGAPCPYEVTEEMLETMA